MTKAFKELIIVFLVGAGTLLLLWGFLHQKTVSFTLNQSTLASSIMWNAVGVGFIIAGALLGLFLKPAKK
jgi:uncharacterized membrane protein YidH (DUF202 family)